MMVFWQEKLALLATPKTASTAIEAALGSLAAVVIQRPRALKHTDAMRFAAHWKPYLADAAGAEFEVAALMREPRDWLGSWYRDGQRDDVEPERSTQGMSFDEFVQAYCAEGPKAGYVNVGSQSAFLGGTGPCRVNRVFRYEELDHFVDFLEDRLGCEIILPRLNVSPTANTSLSFQTESLLRKVCAEDFALYETLQRA